jgi:hypothetical protein
VHWLVTKSRILWTSFNVFINPSFFIHAILMLSNSVKIKTERNVGSSQGLCVKSEHLLVSLYKLSVNLRTLLTLRTVTNVRIFL